MSADWLAAAATFFAAIAALAAVWVSVLQLRAARRQTLANLFDARFKIYRDLTAVLGTLKQTATLRRKELNLCREAYHSGSVLFAPSLQPSLERIFNLAFSIENAQSRIDATLARGETRDDLDQQIEANREELEPLLDGVTRLMSRDVGAWRT